MMIRRLIRHVLRRPADEGGDLGAPPAPAPAPIESAPPTSAPAPAPAASEQQPTSMHDAMWHRDESGRFAPKPVEPTGGTPVQGQAQPAAAQPGAQPPAPAAVPKPGEPPVPEDITAMPDGLAPKAQERFRTLANGI